MRRTPRHEYVAPEGTDMRRGQTHYPADAAVTSTVVETPTPTDHADSLLMPTKGMRQSMVKNGIIPPYAPEAVGTALDGIETGEQLQRVMAETAAKIPDYYKKLRAPLYGVKAGALFATSQREQLLGGDEDARRTVSYVVALSQASAERPDAPKVSLTTALTATAVILRAYKERKNSLTHEIARQQEDEVANLARKQVLTDRLKENLHVLALAQQRLDSLLADPISRTAPPEVNENLVDFLVADQTTVHNGDGDVTTEGVAGQGSLFDDGTVEFGPTSALANQRFQEERQDANVSALVERILADRRSLGEVKLALENAVQVAPGLLAEFERLQGVELKANREKWANDLHDVLAHCAHDTEALRAKLSLVEEAAVDDESRILDLLGSCLDSQIDIPALQSTLQKIWEGIHKEFSTEKYPVTAEQAQEAADSRAELLPAGIDELLRQMTEGDKSFGAQYAEVATICDKLLEILAIRESSHLRKITMGLTALQGVGVDLYDRALELDETGQRSQGLLKQIASGIRARDDLILRLKSQEGADRQNRDTRLKLQTEIDTLDVAMQQLRDMHRAYCEQTQLQMEKEFHSLSPEEQDMCRMWLELTAGDLTASQDYKASPEYLGLAHTAQALKQSLEVAVIASIGDPTDPENPGILAVLNELKEELKANGAKEGEDRAALDKTFMQIDTLSGVIKQLVLKIEARQKRWESEVAVYYPFSQPVDVGVEQSSSAVNDKHRDGANPAYFSTDARPASHNQHALDGVYAGFTDEK